MKNIIIYSTCQGGILSGLLKQSTDLQKEYRISYFTNFSKPGETKCDIPEQDLRDCALLLYHPIVSKNGGFGTDQLLAQLPDSANAYVVPYVTFGSYWPDFGKIPSSPLGRDQQYPYGRIPYRSEILDGYVASGATPSEALEAYLALGVDDVRSRVDTVFQADMRYLDRLDAQDGPIKVKDYVLDTFCKRQLFFIFNHPKTEIYGHMTNQLLSYLGHGPLAPEVLARFSGHVEQNLPIHPATAAALGLEFVSEDSRYPFLGETFTFAEFIQRYLDYIYSDVKAA